MLILLPPSETKRPGGEGAPWDASRLAFSELTPIRESVIDALVQLSDDPDAAAKVLKLGPKQRGEIERMHEWYCTSLDGTHDTLLCAKWRLRLSPSPSPSPLCLSTSP